jgi:hypothetical protein
MTESESKSLELFLRKLQFSVGGRLMKAFPGHQHIMGNVLILNIYKGYVIIRGLISLLLLADRSEEIAIPCKKG